MIETIIQNTKTVIFMSSEREAVSLRFSEFNGRFYVAMNDVWPYRDTRGKDMESCIFDLVSAELAYLGTSDVHVIGDDDQYGCCAASETSYLSREATTLLKLSCYLCPDRPLAKIFDADGLDRVFEQIALSFAANGENGTLSSQHRAGAVVAA